MWWNHLDGTRRTILSPDGMIDDAVSRRDACEALGPLSKLRCALGEDTSISLRIELGSDTLLGPGKAALLSGIRTPAPSPPRGAGRA